MAVTTISEQTALQVAEWRSIAALTGEPFHRVAGAAIRARVGGGRVLTAGECWLNMSDRTRLILLSMATDRATVERVRWDQLTEGEQMRVGALARSLMRDLDAGARMLRV